MESDRLKYAASMDFDDFIDNVYALLTFLWGEDWGVFTIMKPTTSNGRDIPMPRIVYSLKQVEPGLVGKNVREISPRHRESFIELSPLTGEEVLVEIKGRVMDCMVEFTIYAENNFEASRLTKSFRQVMEKYKGVLMGRGLQNMWFQKEYERNDRENSEEKVSSRGVLYLVKLEELFRTEQLEMQQVTINLDVAKNLLELEGKLPSQQADEPIVIVVP